MSPSIPKVKAHASNESAMGDYCKFAQAVLSLSPIKGFDVDFDLGIEQGNSVSLMDHVLGLSCALTVRFGLN